MPHDFGAISPKGHGNSTAQSSAWNNLDVPERITNATTTLPGGLSRAAAVTAALRHDIVTGSYLPGQRITEEHLGIHYGVSRVPVREAIRTLEAEGFLRVVPYWGTTVSKLTHREIEDLLEVRRSLEQLAVRGAALRHSKDELLKMRQLISQAQTAIEQGQAKLLSSLNTSFHLLIAASCGNSALMPVLAPLSAKIEWIYAASLPLRASQSWAEHKAIVAAIGRGDPDSALEALERHITNATKAHQV